MASNLTSRPYFLGRFSDDDVYALIRTTGLDSHLVRHGVYNAFVSFIVDDKETHRLDLYDGSTARGKRLLTLCISESNYALDAARYLGEGWVTLLHFHVIEWVSVSIPTPFKETGTTQSPQPGKAGTGILPFLLEMVHHFGTHAQKDGILATATQFHLAAMAYRRFFFIDPVREGLFRAVLRDCGGYPIAGISRGVKTGAIINNSTGSPYLYHPSSQLYPLAATVNEYFDSSQYNERVRAVMEENSFTFDYKKIGVRNKTDQFNHMKG